MDPVTIIDDNFQAEDDDNLNDYNDWSARDADWDVDDSFVYDSDIFRTDTAGAYSWINTLPRHLYPDNAYGIAYGWQFYNHNVTDYDQSLVFGATDDTSKNNWWQSGVRVRVLKYFNNNDNARIRIYNQNVVVYDNNINFITDTSQAYTFVTLQPDGTGFVVFTQEGLGFTDLFDLGQGLDYSGLFYGSITNRNGQQSGSSRCYSSCDKIDIIEYPMGTYDIYGIVYRNNTPVSGATVHLITNEATPRFSSVITGDTGAYRFSDLDPFMLYTLTAENQQGNSFFSTLTRPGIRPIFIPYDNG